MPYADRFIPTDELILHLSGITPGITDPGLLANYAGFLSVSAVTVYELAIKDIFEAFAKKKHKTFGYFIQGHFERINGRIKLDNLKNDHIQGFGNGYVKKFKNELAARESSVFALVHLSVKNCYNNLIICRHQFVHGGSPTLSFGEVVTNYNHGKHVIHSLDKAMRR